MCELSKPLSTASHQRKAPRTAATTVAAIVVALLGAMSPFCITFAAAAHHEAPNAQHDGDSHQHNNNNNNNNNTLGSSDHEHYYGDEGITSPIITTRNENSEPVATAAATTRPLRAGEHTCIHDSPAFQEALHRTLHSVTQKYKSAGRDGHFSAQAINKIRIVTSTKDLEDPARYCAYTGQTGINNMQGSTAAACTSDDVLDAAKKATLLEKVLPAAIKIISDSLLVESVTGNLQVGIGCVYNSVPSEHTQNGVPNADFALYISAAPTTGSTVAWAGACATDGTTGRPIVGRANFSPAYLRWSDDDPRGQRMLVRTAVHELLHAMGFSSGVWSSKGLTAKEARRGREKTIVTSPNALAAAQDHFGCSTLTGAEIEDEGGAGTAGSHWERRTHYDDVMSGVVGDDMYMSRATLGLLADLGYYQADWSKAESPVWMRGAGCGAHADKCNTVSGGSGRYFCDPLTQVTATCDASFRRIGMCQSRSNFGDGEIPAEEQYFPSNPRLGGSTALMNYCPIVVGYSNRVCDSYTGGTNDTVQAFYYGSDGMCFAVSTGGVIQTGYNGGDATPARCLQRRCLLSGTTDPITGAPNQILEFRVGSSATWIRCVTKGQAISLAPYGYSGTVYCPGTDTHCPLLSRAPSNETAGPSETLTTVTNATTTRATTSAVSTTMSSSTATSTTTTTTTTTTTLPPISTLPPTNTSTPTPPLPPAVSPAEVRPLSPVTHFLYLTLTGKGIINTLLFIGENTTVASTSQYRQFKAALEADVADRLDVFAGSPAAASFTGDANRPRGSIILDRHVPTVAIESRTVTERYEVEALALRFLVSTPARVTGFMMSLWIQALNGTRAGGGAHWMHRAQAIYANSVLAAANSPSSGVLANTDNDASTAASSSGHRESRAVPLRRLFSPEASGNTSNTTAAPPFAVEDPRFSDPFKASDSTLLTDCGPLGCVATVAVATVGGWAAAVLIGLAIYQMCLFWLFSDTATDKRGAKTEKTTSEKNKNNEYSSSHSANNERSIHATTTYPFTPSGVGFAGKPDYQAEGADTRGKDVRGGGAPTSYLKGNPSYYSTSDPTTVDNRSHGGGGESVPSKLPFPSHQ